MMGIADKLGMYANDKPEEIISRDRGRKAAAWIQKSKIKGERDMLSVKTKNGREFINIFTSATIDDWTYLIDQDDKAVAKLKKKLNFHKRAKGYCNGQLTMDEVFAEDAEPSGT
jgi:hypothetical protein